jgi:hypothetical protein
MYRMNSTGRELWHWTQIDIRAPTHGPNGGVADSLGEAEAAFPAAWEAGGYGLLSLERADEKARPESVC